MTVRLEIENNSENEIPKVATKGSAGFDIRSAEDCVVNAKERRLIHTGIKVNIPEGYEIQVRPRSGLAFKHGITVLNAPGTIDSDYTGEIGVILYNTSEFNFEVKKGDRIAQLVLSEVVKPNFVVVDCITDSTEEGRGSNGFGSTGVS